VIPYLGLLPVALGLRAARALSRWGHPLFPAVLIAIGLSILAHGGAFAYDSGPDGGRIDGLAGGDPTHSRVRRARRGQHRLFDPPAHRPGHGALAVHLHQAERVDHRGAEGSTLAHRTSAPQLSSAAATRCSSPIRSEPRSSITTAPVASSSNQSTRGSTRSSSADGRA